MVILMCSTMLPTWRTPYLHGSYPLSMTHLGMSISTWLSLAMPLRHDYLWSSGSRYLVYPRIGVLGMDIMISTYGYEDLEVLDIIDTRDPRS